MTRTDEGQAGIPLCGHCGAPLEVGRMTCPGCGQVRSLAAAAVDAEPAPLPAPPPGVPERTPAAAEPEDEAPEIDLTVSIFEDAPRRRPRTAAPRSHTSLLVGGLIGLVLVVLVAAAALWALSQNSGTADF